MSNRRPEGNMEGRKETGRMGKRMKKKEGFMEDVKIGERD